MTNAEIIAKRAKAGRLLLIAVVAGACVLSLYAIAVNVQQGSDITNVHNDVTRIESPCQRFGSESKRCQEAFETAVASINHRIACYIEHQAGDDVPDCQGVSLLIDSSSSKGGGAQQTGSTGHQQPSPHHGGGGSGAGKGGGRGSPAPGSGGSGQPPAPTGSTPSSQPAPATSSSPGTSGGAGGSEDAPANPIAEGAGGTLEAAGGAVSETAKGANEAVGGTVEDVKGKTCDVVAVGC